MIEDVIEQAENSGEVKKMREVHGNIDKLLREMLQVNDDDLNLFKKMFGDAITKGI